MFLLLILLLILMFSSVPAWGYSRSWGYYPSGTVGLILIILIIMIKLYSNKCSIHRVLFYHKLIFIRMNED